MPRLLRALGVLLLVACKPPPRVAPSTPGQAAVPAVVEVEPKVATERVCTQLGLAWTQAGNAAGSLEWHGDGWTYVVTYEGLNIVIECGTDDVGYVRIVVPNFYELEHAWERIATREAMGHVGDQIKVAKIVYNHDQSDVHAIVSFIAPPGGISGAILMRYLAMVAGAAHAFVARMGELAPRGEAAAPQGPDAAPNGSTRPVVAPGHP